MRTTKKHFRIFKKECKKWIKVFGLYGWDWRFYHEETKPNNLAQSNYHSTHRWANITLNTDWGDLKITLHELKKTAFHEVLETGLLGNLRCLAEDRRFNQEEFDGEIHQIIERLSKVIMGGG